HHEAVEIWADDRLDVALGEPSVDAVDPDDHDGVVVRGQRGSRRRPRGDLLCVCDGVLEVEHDRVRAELTDLLEPAGVVSGCKQERTEGLVLPVDCRTPPVHVANESIFYFY